MTENFIRSILSFRKAQHAAPSYAFDVLKGHARNLQVAVLTEKANSD